MAAQYYVSASGSNTWPYNTWEKAANTIQTVLTELAGGADAIVEIEAGTYTESLQVYSNTATASTRIIVKASEEDGHSGEVKIIGATDEAIEGEVGSNYFDFHNIYFKSASGQPAWRMVGPTNWRHYGCTIDSDAVQFATSGPADFYYCKFLGCGDHTGTMSLESAGETYTFVGCYNGPHEGRYAGHFNLRNGSQVHLYNCYIEGLWGSVVTIANNAASGCIIKNCVIGSFMGSAASPQIVTNTAGGTVVEENNTFIQCGYNTDAGYGLTPDSSDITDSIPPYSAYGYNEGYFCVSTDDGEAPGGGASQYAFAKEIADVCTSKGVKMCWYVERKGFVKYYTTTAEQAAILREFTDAGHEIGVHGWTGALWNATAAFTATGAVAGATIDVDIATDTITCYDATNGSQVISDFSTKTVGAINTELNALTGWSTGGLAVGMVTAGLGSSIADTSGAQAADGGYIVLLDRSGYSSGFFYDEITQTKAWIEETIGGGYVAKTARPPAFGVDNDAIDAMRDCGLIGSFSSTGVIYSNRDLKALPVYAAASVGSGGIWPAVETQDTLTNAGAALATQLVTLGQVTCLLTHQDSEFSAEQVGWILDGILSVPGVNVLTPADSFTAIRASGTPDANSLVYSRNIANQINLSVVSGSDTIGSGRKWWSGAEPLGLDGEPLSDIDTDIGCIQSTLGPFHPVNI